jgi:hypothetical protein
MPQVTDLTLQPSATGALTPTQRATANMELVRVLAPVVKKSHVVKIQGKEYLQVAGCQAIGSGLGYTTGTLSVQFIEEQGGLPARWEATVGVYDCMTGMMVAKGTSAVFLDEPRWRKADHFACMGMAQTRATGRALKGVMGWAFSLIGVEGSFAEEMPVDGPTTAQDAPAPARALPAPSKASKPAGGKQASAPAFQEIRGVCTGVQPKTSKSGKEYYRVGIEAGEGIEWFTSFEPLKFDAGAKIVLQLKPYGDGMVVHDGWVDPAAEEVPF